MPQYALAKQDAAWALCQLDLAQHLSTQLLDTEGKISQETLLEMEGHS